MDQKENIGAQEEKKESKKSEYRVMLRKRKT